MEEQTPPNISGNSFICHLNLVHSTPELEFQLAEFKVNLRQLLLEYYGSFGCTICAVDSLEHCIHLDEFISFVENTVRAHDLNQFEISAVRSPDGLIFSVNPSLECLETFTSPECISNSAFDLYVEEGVYPLSDESVISDIEVDVGQSGWETE